MLSKKDLDKQKTFSRSDDGVWYSDCWEYCIIFEAHGAKLYSHCETYGNIEFLKDLDSSEDLKDSYELLTNKEFI